MHNEDKLSQWIDEHDNEIVIRIGDKTVIGKAQKRLYYLVDSRKIIQTTTYSGRKIGKIGYFAALGVSSFR